MNKLLVMVLCVFSFTLVRAQSLDPIIYTNTLKNSKWIQVNKRLIGFDEVSKDDVYRLDTVFISFDNSKMHKHHKDENPITGEKIDKIIKGEYSYYLTNEAPKKFEKSKIGKVTSGKYIVWHNTSSKNVDPEEYEVWEVVETDNSKIVLQFKDTSLPYVYIIEGAKITFIKKE
jgi:hypothetical protein